MEKIALITGATSGIGRATALKLAEAGYDLIIAGRKMIALRELEHEIEEKFDRKILVRSFNIKEYQQVEDSLKNTLPREWRKIDVLVNCAGIGLNFCPIHEGIIQDWDTMIDTNIKGLLYVTRLVAPGMVDRGFGHIINIGSILRDMAVPNFNVYSATKYAVDGLCKNMRLDLQPHGVHVTQIMPGRVKTGFFHVSFKGDKQKVEESYKEYSPLEANDVADAVLYSISQPSHVNIREINLASIEQL